MSPVNRAKIIHTTITAWMELMNAFSGIVNSQSTEKGQEWGRCGSEKDSYRDIIDEADARGLSG